MIYCIRCSTVVSSADYQHIRIVDRVRGRDFLRYPPAGFAIVWLNLEPDDHRGVCFDCVKIHGWGPFRDYLRYREATTETQLAIAEWLLPILPPTYVALPDTGGSIVIWSQAKSPLPHDALIFDSIHLEFKDGWLSFNVYGFEEEIEVHDELYCLSDPQSLDTVRARILEVLEQAHDLEAARLALAGGP